VDELVEEARLAHAQLAYHGHDLPAPLLRLFEGSPELLHFEVAPDEPAEPPSRGGLEARPRGGGPG
jgi:hypothetical protein